jgi:hypothetical protein
MGSSKGDLTMSKLAKLGGMLLSFCLAVLVTAAQAEIRIVAVGHGAQAAIPQQLEAALKARGYDVVVSSAGAWSYKMSAALQRLDEAVPEGTHIVLMSIGFDTESADAMARIDRVVAHLHARHAEVVAYAWPDLEATQVSHGTAMLVAYTLPLVEEVITRLNRDHCAADCADEDLPRRPTAASMR